MKCFLKKLCTYTVLSSFLFQILFPYAALAGPFEKDVDLGIELLCPTLAEKQTHFTLSLYEKGEKTLSCRLNPQALEKNSPVAVAPNSPQGVLFGGYRIAASTFGDLLLDTSQSLQGTSVFIPGIGSLSVNEQGGLVLRGEPGQDRNPALSTSLPKLGIRSNNDVIFQDVSLSKATVHSPTLWIFGNVSTQELDLEALPHAHLKESGILTIRDGGTLHVEKIHTPDQTITIKNTGTLHLKGSSPQLDLGNHLLRTGGKIIADQAQTFRLRAQYVENHGTIQVGDPKNPKSSAQLSLTATTLINKKDALIQSPTFEGQIADLTNHGALRSQNFDLKVKKFKNDDRSLMEGGGKLQVSYSGENRGTMALDHLGVDGKFGPISGFQNNGRLDVNTLESCSYFFFNQGQLQGKDLIFKGCLDNFYNTESDFFNRGHIEAQNSITLENLYFRNDERGTLNLKGFTSLDTVALKNIGSIGFSSPYGTSYWKGSEEITNYGLIVARCQVDAKTPSFNQHGTLKLSRDTTITSQRYTNTGTTLWDQNLSLKGNQLTNRGTLEGGFQSSLDVQSTDRFTNEGRIKVESFTLKAPQYVNKGTTQAQEQSFKTSTYTNKGHEQSKRFDLNTQVFDNQGTLNVQKASVRAGLDSRNIGSIQGNSFSLNALSIINDGDISSSWQSYRGGSLDNNGSMDGAININISNSIRNNGSISGSSLSAKADSITSNGNISSSYQSYRGNSLTNNGSMDGNIDINVSNSIRNNGSISGPSLSAYANSTTNNGNISSSSQSYRGNSLTNNGSMSGDSIGLHTRSAYLNSGSSLRADTLSSTSSYLRNDGDTETNHFSFSGSHLQNNNRLVANKSAFIDTHTFDDRSDAYTRLEGLNYTQTGLDFSTKGHFETSKATFNGVENFKSTGHAVLKDSDLTFKNFETNKLSLANAHVTFKGDFENTGGIYSLGGLTDFMKRKKSPLPQGTTTSLLLISKPKSLLKSSRFT